MIGAELNSTSTDVTTHKGSLDNLDFLAVVRDINYEYRLAFSGLVVVRHRHLNCKLVVFNSCGCIVEVEPDVVCHNKRSIILLAIVEVSGDFLSEVNVRIEVSYNVESDLVTECDNVRNSNLYSVVILIGVNIVTTVVRSDDKSNCHRSNTGVVTVSAYKVYSCSVSTNVNCRCNNAVHIGNYVLKNLNSLRKSSLEFDTLRSSVLLNNNRTILYTANGNTACIDSGHHISRSDLPGLVLLEVTKNDLVTR